MLIKIGGRDETVPVHIEDGTRSYRLNASREMARKLAPHLFGKTHQIARNGKVVQG